MKSKLTKIFSAALVSIGIFSVPANANDYTGWRTNTIIYSNPMIVYADSSQWDYRFGGWMCATADFHQAYSNSWIYTNGKWYYVNNDGKMEANVLLGDKYSKKTYSLDESGAMQTNTYYKYGNNYYYINDYGLVNLPESYYNAISYYKSI